MFYDLNIIPTSQLQKGGSVELYIQLYITFLIFVCIFVDSVSIGTITPSPLSPGTIATGKSIIVYYDLVDYFFS